MSAEETLSLSPEQRSDVEAASEQVYVQAVEDVVDQSTGLDTAALLTIALIVILYHVVWQDTRTTAQIALAIRLDTLRKALTVVLGFLSLTVFIGERKSGERINWRNPTRLIPGGVLALYTLYIASFTFLGLELLTNSIVPAIAEYAALLSVIALWQPWTRIRLYRKVSRRLLPTLLIFVGVLAAWELVIKVFDIQRFLLPAPSVILDTFLRVYPRLVSQGWLTFQNAWWGFAIGCGAGILFGLLSARFTGFSRALMPYAIAVNSVPIIAFAPITNVWFGLLNPMSKIAIVVILTFFPAMINTVRGLTSADPSSLELMRSYAATSLEVFRRVRLPTALPYIFNALKLATTLSMIGAIVAEYFGGPTTGLGVNIANDAALIRYPMVWSEIIIASALGIMFYFVVSMVERLVMPWHISFRGEAD
ncbi:MAG: ABC transporter permease [Anaerolineae bacterium]|nr:ABC transporter permease [Anaerolineae bacterium]